jgi:hypothetical protein
MGRVTFGAAAAALATAIGLAAAGPASAAGAQAAIVDSPRYPLNGSQRLVFREDWRLRDDDPAYLVGMPVDATEASHQVFILDQQLQTVFAFDDRGGFERTFGQGGEGPGDFQSPCKLVVLGAEALGVLDRSPARLHEYDLEGNLRGSYPVEGNALRVAGYDIKGSDSLFVVLRSEVDKILDTNRAGTISRTGLVGVTLTGQAESVFVERQRELAYFGATQPVLEEEQYVLSGFDVFSNHLYAATAREDYAVRVFDRWGRMVRELRRDYSPRRRTPSERDSISADRSVSVGGCAIVVEYRAAEYDQAILDLRVAHDGSVWVLSSRGARETPRGVYQIWDVFDRQGRFSRQVEIVIDANPRLDKLFWLDDDKVILCRNWVDADEAFQNSPRANGDKVEPVSAAQGIDLQVVCMKGAWE